VGRVIFADFWKGGEKGVPPNCCCHVGELFGSWKITELIDGTNSRVAKSSQCSKLGHSANKHLTRQRNIHQLLLSLYLLFRG
jgi:hypothetical protein